MKMDFDNSVKKFEYKFEKFSFDIEYDIELNEKDDYFYSKELLKHFNKFGQDGWEILSFKFCEFVFYDSQDIKRYSHCGHNKPFTAIKVGVYLKREIIEDNKEMKK